MSKPLILLKYAGSKTRFIHIYNELRKNHQEKRWVDVFCGGISAPLNIKPDRVWINDKNPHLYNLYTVVQKYGDDMPKVELKNEEKYYYKLREEFNNADPFDWNNAHRLIVMNKTSFNGLFRFNRSGKYNSPFGHYHSPAFPTNLNIYKDIMKDWEITNMDWEDAFFRLNDDDFVVLDPPYVTEFTAYTPDGFNWKDQVALAEKAAELTQPVILHNQDTPEIKDLYTSLGFDIQHFWREDKINSHRAKGNKVSEIIATRNI